MTVSLTSIEFDSRQFNNGARRSTPARSFHADFARALDERSFEYRGAYESRGALSLADRSAYGIRDGTTGNHPPNVAARMYARAGSSNVAARIHARCLAPRIDASKRIVAARIYARLPNAVARIDVRLPNAAARIDARSPHPPARMNARPAKMFRCAALLGRTRVICIAWGGKVQLAVRTLRKDRAL